MNLKTLPKLGLTEWLFVILIICSVVAYPLAHLPATSNEVSDLVSLARSNSDALQMVASALAVDPSPNRIDVYRLRERVTRIEAAAQTRALNPQLQAVDEERRRLDAMPFSQMDNGDRVHWLIFALVRYTVLIVGVIGGCIAVPIVRRSQARAAERT
jgi:hypothetical protein